MSVLYVTGNRISNSEDMGETNVGSVAVTESTMEWGDARANSTAPNVDLVDNAGMSQHALNSITDKADPAQTVYGSVSVHLEDRAAGEPPFPTPRVIVIGKEFSFIGFNVQEGKMTAICLEHNLKVETQVQTDPQMRF